VYWTVEDLQALSNQDKKPSTERPKEFFMPLACIIEPKLIDSLQKTAGSKYGINPPKWARQGEYEDMYSWDAQQFLKFVGGIVENKAPTGNQAL